MPKDDGLICAYRVGSDGSAAPLDRSGVEQSGKGAEAEDMVSIRLRIGPDRIISTPRRRLMAVRELPDTLDTGVGPESIGDFVIDLINGLLDRTARDISGLDERLDDLEETAREALASEARKNLPGLRRRAILLRRYLAPQRDAPARLVAMRTELFDDSHRGALREISDRVLRFVEELEAPRDRSAVIQDGVTTRLAGQINTAMYRLPVIASIFLPLSLFTGLLGIDVAGIPGTEANWAFWAVCALLIVLAGVSIWIIGHLKRVSAR